jgi:hypothetical protein
MSPRLASSLVLACVLASLLSAGCATVKKDQQALAFQAATSAYQRDIRWGYYQDAFAYVHPDQRKGKPLPAMFKGLRVTDYEVVQPPVMPDRNTAIQVVDIEYLYEDRQVVKRLTDNQTWRWDDKLDSWWLHSGLPKFE